MTHDPTLDPRWSQGEEKLDCFLCAKIVLRKDAYWFREGKMESLIEKPSLPAHEACLRTVPLHRIHEQYILNLGDIVGAQLGPLPPRVS